MGFKKLLKELKFLINFFWTYNFWISDYWKKIDEDSKIKILRIEKIQKEFERSFLRSFGRGTTLFSLIESQYLITKTPEDSESTTISTFYATVTLDTKRHLPSHQKYYQNHKNTIFPITIPHQQYP
uniref:Uncharacterized protein n=1 Tax=Panagrolaimus sp. ES5 TaxID=591445 RepID=A0AC34F6L7_9BILA